MEDCISWARKLILPDRYVFQPAVRHDLARVLPPEFINRIDKIILFKPLSMAAVREIVNMKLIRRTQSLLWDNDIFIKFEDTVTDPVVEKG